MQIKHALKTLGYNFLNSVAASQLGKGWIVANRAARRG